jgi:hypothetical protein
LPGGQENYAALLSLRQSGFLSDLICAKDRGHDRPCPPDQDRGIGQHQEPEASGNEPDDGGRKATQMQKP